MKKLFNRSLWSLLTSFFAIWLVIAIVGETYAVQYSSTINNLLGINPYEVVGGGDATYYASDYLTADGKYDDVAMRKNSMEVAAQTASDGSILLWNNNNALPLAENSRVSLFGIGTVNYKFSGGGSGEIKSSPADNFKAALEKSSTIKVNGTLFQAYAALRDNYGSRNVQGVQTNDNKYNGKNGYTDERYREFYVNEPSWNVVEGKMSGGKTIESTLVGSKNAPGYGDAAIMVITRDGAEDGDTWFYSNECLDNNYLDLSTQEAEILSKLQSLKEAGTIGKIVLLMNTNSVMQMKHIKQYDIDACVHVGAGGVQSFEAISNILTGKTNPNGALVDTMAYDNYSAPATVNFGDFKWTNSTGLPGTDIGTYNNAYVVYQEGIYVGYRYYETRYEDVVMGNGNADSTKGTKQSTDRWSYAEEVAFPFGYGQSYTTFGFSNYKVTHTDGAFGGTYTITVDVKNTGKVAGKSIVGIYLQKPYTDYDKVMHIEKSAVELVGFAKTALLQPDGSETVTVTVKGSEFKTYDAYGKGTYILEKGDYYLSFGTDAHDALNNILAAKGYNKSNGMVDSLGNATDGNSAFAHKVTVVKDDYTTYAKSEYTDYEITNQLSDADLNLYKGTKDDQSITYLSRNDWEQTYPVPVQLECVNSTMVSDMQYSHTLPDDGSTMPTQGKVTVPDSFWDDIVLEEGQEKRLNLALLKDKDYNDPVWQNLIDQLTWAEMNYLLSGGYLTVQGNTKNGVPGGKANDGTSGVRTNNPTTGDLMGFPSATVMAQTWDTALINKLGDAFGHECLHTGVIELYAPCAGTHRTPYGGRNWEYYSEDPYMSAKMLGAESLGLQNKGVIVCAKHFAFNDQEINRCGVATWMNEQTAREIYLRAFEGGIVEARILSLMASFPRLGTKWVGACKGLFTDILRGEWGFEGFVETDSAFNQDYMTKGTGRAEGVYAGVAFWMDGTAWEQWGTWKDNPTIVNAVREAVHGMLYAQAHSMAMNGITANSRIVYVTPWWIDALNKVQLALGIVTGCMFAMAVASFVIHFVDKRKSQVA